MSKSGVQVRFNVVSWPFRNAWCSVWMTWFAMWEGPIAIHFSMIDGGEE